MQLLDNQALKAKLKPLTERNTENKLFLATATAWNAEETKIPMMWISNSINTYDTNYENALNITGDMFEKDSDNLLRKFTNNILKEADINICDYEFESHGYNLKDGKLYISEEEAEAIRIIFDQYIHTDSGSIGIAKYLANHGIQKRPRQNGTNPLFDAVLIRNIIKKEGRYPNAEKAKAAEE